MKRFPQRTASTGEMLAFASSLLKNQWPFGWSVQMAAIKTDSCLELPDIRHRNGSCVRNLYKRVVLLSCHIFTISIYNASICGRRSEYLLPEGSIHFKLMWTSFKFGALAKSFVDDKDNMRWACAIPGCPISFGSFTTVAENGNTSN